LFLVDAGEYHQQAFDAAEKQAFDAAAWQRWADCKIFQSESSPDPKKLNLIQSWTANFWKLSQVFKKIAVRSNSDPAKIDFSPDPVRSSLDPCSSLLPGHPD